MLLLFAFGLLHSHGAEPLRGVRLLAAAETQLRRRGIDIRTEGMCDVMVMKEAVDRILATARARYETAVVEAAWSDGQQMTMEQAVALATEGEDADAPPAP